MAAAKYTGRAVQAHRALVAATYGLTCHLCHKPINSFAEMETDHLIPRSDPRCPGPFDLANSRPAHGTRSAERCNQRRQRRAVESYRASRDVDELAGFFRISGTLETPRPPNPTPASRPRRRPRRPRRHRGRVAARSGAVPDRCRGPRRHPRPDHVGSPVGVGMTPIERQALAVVAAWRAAAGGLDDDDTLALFRALDRLDVLVELHPVELHAPSTIEAADLTVLAELVVDHDTRQHVEARAAEGRPYLGPVF